MLSLTVTFTWFFQVLGSVLLLASACSGSYLGYDVSSQYQAQDGVGGYSYGYADPNSQKHESKDAHGVTHGEYSYIDAHGHVQKVQYTADPKHGFQVVGTNLPKGPAPAAHAVAPSHYAAARSYSYPVVLGHDGAPLETPEVKAAKAAHFAAHAQAKAGLYKRSAYAPTAHWDHYTPEQKKWHGPQHYPVIVKGVPVETPEVQHAKAAHAAAYAKVAKNDKYAPIHEPTHHHAKSYYASEHVPVIKNGVPVETPEVRHAKAAHAAAHAKAATYGGHYAPHWDHHAPEPKAWHGPLHYPVIVKGVPVETPEVQHAKAAHVAAYAKVANSGRYTPIHEDQYARSYGSWHTSQYVPVVIKNGVPVETPEVQHAKTVFLKAHATASAQSRSYGHEDDGSYKPHAYHHSY
ncbi:uncharacterized protein LOC129761662 [Toxorhynchites rutilus septentrionalis]|uniref:uncharacterized protein LOC129761662 n=1 Tax=Toxorhynchites rutilus septentrionalis TaxID=329112 RepID=UPI00247897EC|nr:uncharacterized protein LOC129761662 [Toxorhynchites rutilus septentrionalis]